MKVNEDLNITMILHILKLKGSWRCGFDFFESRWSLMSLCGALLCIIIFHGCCILNSNEEEEAISSTSYWPKNAVT